MKKDGRHELELELYTKFKAIHMAQLMETRISFQCLPIKISSPFPQPPKRRTAQRAQYPPSMIRSVPVVYVEASDTK